MGAPGCADSFLGLLAGGIKFDQKRFARDIGLFKPQARRACGGRRACAQQR